MSLCGWKHVYNANLNLYVKAIKNQLIKFFKGTITSDKKNQNM